MTVHFARMKTAAVLVTLFISTLADVSEVSSTDYLLLSAAEKSERLWTNCQVDTSPAAWFSPFSLLVGLMTESMCPTFTSPGDELPPQGSVTRDKMIHTVGAVGRVEWVDRGSHSYTGIFQGASYGLARLSLAKEPSVDELTTAPGMGLKFLRNGTDSANLVAMYSVNGQESWNFFANDFSNHIPRIGLAAFALAAKFATATRNIRQVGISDWGRYGDDGVEVDTPRFPYRLRFHPTGEISFSDDYVRPTTEDLKTISAGTTLYQVFALDNPAEQGGTEKHIADLVLTSDMMTSLWGDQHLFFRHQDMVEDLRLHPGWNTDTPQFSIFKQDPSRKSPCH